MRMFLKKIPFVKTLSSYIKAFRQNPDLVERIEKYIFEVRHGKLVQHLSTPREDILVQELRKNMSALPLELPDESTPGPERKWMNYKNTLREKILTEDPREFLGWDVVAWAMGSSIRRSDYEKLSRFPFWKVWSRLLANLPAPASRNQYPYFKFPQSDGKTLQQVHHLAQLRSLFDRDVSDMDFIVEFGGGYGAMCSAIYALGFKGTYVLYDSPEFLLLQRFYLQLNNIDISKIRFISSLPQLKEEVAEKNGLFIGMWSVSEVSTDLRDKLFEIIHPEDYLIGYQRSFGGAENNIYFQDFITAHTDISWKDYPIFELRGAGDRYLVGSSKTHTSI